MNTEQIIALSVMAGICIVLIFLSAMIKRKIFPSTPSSTSTAKPPSAKSPATKNWSFKNFKELCSATLAFVIAAGAITLLVFGVIRVKRYIDSSLNASIMAQNGELVTLDPNSSVIIPIYRCGGVEYHPPVNTVVEFLDENHDPLPIRNNGQIVYYVYSGPGTENEYGLTRGESHYIRFTSESMNRYSFKVIKF